MPNKPRETSKEKPKESARRLNRSKETPNRPENKSREMPNRPGNKSKKTPRTSSAQPREELSEDKPEPK